MKNTVVVFTVEQSADLAAIINLKTAPHTLGDDFPRTCRTSYDIGYLDALKAAHDLLADRYIERAAGGSRP